jgi:protein-S-isoprenylcysteine O-methyltransferase Ste14
LNKAVAAFGAATAFVLAAKGGMPMTLLKTLLFTILVPGTVTILIPRWLLSAEPARSSSTLRFVGLIPSAVGVAIYFWCAWGFATQGRGTPAPIDPPKKLVARGLYRFTRNPMYVGVLSILIGEAALFASATLFWYAAVAFLFFYLFVVIYEEPALKRQFGEAYKNYCAAVPRWIPRFNSPVGKPAQ